MVDPTANVMALVAAAVERIDDVLAGYVKRQDDLREGAIRLFESEMRRLSEVADLRADHARELMIAESKRIDAIRAVDVNAVAVASERQAAAATALATQVSQAAEAMRVSVAAAATTSATSLQQLSTTLTERLAKLEQSQYEGKGKQAIADPAMVELAAQVRQLTQSQTLGAGKSEGISTSWAVLLGAGSLVAVLIAVWAATH